VPGQVQAQVRVPQERGKQEGPGMSKMETVNHRWEQE